VGSTRKKGRTHMGDRTEFQMNLYAVPDDAKDDVVDLFNAWYFGVDWDDRGTDWTRELLDDVLGGQLAVTDTGFPCGRTGELAELLAGLGCVFEMHEDPKYEWLGERAMFHPKLGDEPKLEVCSAEGESLLSEWRYRQLRDEADGDAKLIELIEEELGIAYADQFADLVREPVTVD